MILRNSMEWNGMYVCMYVCICMYVYYMYVHAVVPKI